MKFKKVSLKCLGSIREASYNLSSFIGLIISSFFSRFSHPFYWSPFLLIGKDVKISLTEIRHAMLDQCLDQSEAEVIEEQGKDYLNPKPVIKSGKIKLL